MRDPNRGAGGPRIAATVLAAAFVVLALSACRPDAIPPVETIKILVESDGIYEVTAPALADVGFDLSGARAEDLVLTSGGQPVSFSLSGRGRQRALRFYGVALGPEAYTARNVYWLSIRTNPGQGASSGAVQEVEASLSAGMTPASVVSTTLLLEEQRQIHPMAQAEADRWLWQTVFAPAEVNIPLDVPDAAGGEALVRVEVVANSSAPIDPDHHLILRWNGILMADVTWDGLVRHTITATVPAGGVRAGENTLTLVAPGDTGAPADAILLDRVTVAYPRQLALSAGQFVFSGQADGYSVRMSGRPALLWDITEPLRPVALSGFDFREGRLQFRGGGERRFAVVAKGGFLAPARILPATGPDLRAWPGGADLLVVTVPELRAALTPLLEVRQAQGLRVAVVDVEQVYDAFTYGRAGPDAIRALVRQATASWTPPAPRYLLLAGDASYDPRGFLKGQEADLVPTQTVRTVFSGWTASDVWYGTDGDSASPDLLLAVGRFPAQNAGQLAVMVAKTLEYERGAGTAPRRGHALLLVDNDEPGFATEAAAFAVGLQHYATDMIAVEGDGVAARERLLRELGAGLGLLGYFGHGSVTLWAQEKVFGVADVAGLRNRDRLPLVFTVTCLSGFFTHPTTPSLGETLLRAEEGGAVAALVPSSAAVLSDQRLLAEGLAAALSISEGTAPGAAGPRLGDIVRQAQASLPTGDSAGLREILLTFNLLGDPTLILAR